MRYVFLIGVWAVYLFRVSIGVLDASAHAKMALTGHSPKLLHAVLQLLQ